jgi:DNA-binding response OmpR family regulator
MAKVLIVEDSQDLQECFAAIFHYRNYDVQMAHSKNTADNMLSIFSPDVILMDVKLSGESGREICKELKATVAKDIPVILISANPELLLEPEECMADDILEKPFSLQLLFEKIDKYLPVA